jgi:hypothetical protein
VLVVIIGGMTSAAIVLTLLCPTSTKECSNETIPTPLARDKHWEEVCYMIYCSFLPYNTETKSLCGSRQFLRMSYALQNELKIIMQFDHK